MSYFNTTNETGGLLKEYRRKASSQDVLVLEMFMNGEPYSPSQVQSAVLPNAPITSVRRSITNLTTIGKLIKTGRKVMGLYNRHEYCWKLNDPQQGELL